MTASPLVALCRGLVPATLWLCLGVYLGTAAPVHATVMVELPLDELIRRADLVVRGKVLRTGTRVRAPNATAATLEPRTHVWISVEETLAGKAPADGVVHLWEPGGRYGDVQTLVAGTPQYERGEDVLVFLTIDKETPGLYRTLEMTQGKYSVLRRDPTSQPFAVRDFNDVSIARWRRHRMELGPPPTEKPVNVNSLSARVRELRLAPVGHKKVRK